MPPKPHIARSTATIQTALQSLLQELSGRDRQFERHSDYQNLLRSCLPCQWQHRVMLQIEKAGAPWILLVDSPLLANQLHQLLPEISENLAKKLPYPPKLKTRAHPDLWTKNPNRRLPINSKRASQFSQQEASYIVSQFLQHGFK